MSKEDCQKHFLRLPTVITNHFMDAEIA